MRTTTTTTPLFSSLMQQQAAAFSRQQAAAAGSKQQQQQQPACSAFVPYLARASLAWRGFDLPTNTHTILKLRFSTFAYMCARRTERREREEVFVQLPTWGYGNDRQTEAKILTTNQPTSNNNSMSTHGKR